MPLQIKRDFIPTTLPTRPGTKLSASYITVHNTDNEAKGAGAAAHNAYVRGPDAVTRMVSWHYTVDDKLAYQHLPDDEVGYHASTKAGNTQSIGIEICMNSDMDVTKGYANAAVLVAHCVAGQKLKFPNCMKQHKDWNSKYCPRVLLDGAKLTWRDFIKLCEEQVEAVGESVAVPAALPMRAEGDGNDWNPENAAEILRSIDDSMSHHHDSE